MALLFISLMLLCIAASLPAPTSMTNPYSHPHLDSPPDSERMVEEEQRDVAALLSFKRCITKDPFGMLSNWTAHNSHNICSSWYGIHCRPHTTRVVAIDLHATQHQSRRGGITFLWETRLEGSLSSSLSSLSLLNSLNLSGNSFTGRIPAEFGHLKSLRALDLSGNGLNGSIPAELGRLQKLRSLHLSLNQLTGRIPAELGSLQQLRSLDLSENLLTGRIPAELGSLQQLEYLLLEFNDFSGTIPHGLGVRNVAQRKLYDELGIAAEDVPVDQFVPLGCILYKAPSDGKWGEHELDYLVFIVRDVAMHPNPEEVVDVKYVSKEQLKELIRKADASEDGVKLSPWFRLAVDNFLFDWWNKDENGTLAEAVDMKTIHKLT